MLALRFVRCSRHLTRAATPILLAAGRLTPAQQPLPPSATATCAAALAQPIPPAPTGGPLPAADLPTCDERNLYYGLDHPADPRAALQCGWYQLAHPQPSIGNMFYGPGVLSMIYANGAGTPRNLDLATRFVCENPWAAPAEFDGRLEHLAHIRQALATSSTGAKPQEPALHFDLCDDATSGLSQGACTEITTRRKAHPRSRQIAALVHTLPAAAQALFPTLQAAERTFETSRSVNEVDLSGTGRAAFSLDEENTLAAQFLINLQRFGQGDLPPTSSAQLTTLRDQLATTLAQLQHAPASQWQGQTITPTGINATQQTYAALVAAWLNFARLAYPKLSPTDIEAQLLRLRQHQLRSLLR